MAARKGQRKQPQQHILIVDDDPSTREWLTDVLQAGGYQTSCAIDGQDALDQLTRLTPDALLLDLGLPRVDGYGVLRALREQGHTMPIIIVTAQHQTNQGAVLGATDLLQKPVEAAWLLDRIKAHLGTE